MPSRKFVENYKSKKDGFFCKIFERNSIWGNKLYYAENATGEVLFGGMLFNTIEEIKKAVNQ